MYGNICKTIKAWAVFLLVLSLIVTLIVSILFMETHENIANYGALIFLFGIISSFTSYYLLYGFGQLVENSDIIAAEYKRKNEKQEKVDAQIARREEKRRAEKRDQQRKEAANKVIDPNIKEDVFIDIPCPNCYAQLSYTKEQLQGDEKLVCPFCDGPISL